MNEPINSFILSAGLGERLRPITNHIPKPLLPILGKPALQYVIERASAIGVKKIGINLHYKKELITDWLLSSNLIDLHRITLFYEKRLLGTGGALKNAADFLRISHFLVYNSDIFSDIDLERLIEYHFSGNYIATLAIHDNSEYNSILIDEKGFLNGISKTKHPLTTNLYAFTGIAIYSPDFLKFLPDGFSSVVTGWLDAISNGAKIACLQFNGHNWSDIGTPSAYASTIIKELKTLGESIYIHPSINNIRDIEIEGNIVIEKDSTIQNGTYLKNCILLPGANIKAKSKYENCIIGNTFKIELPQKVFSATDTADAAVIIGEGGSDRRYYRIKKDDKSFVLMKTSKNDPDFNRQIELTNFFYSIKIPVPRLIEVNSNNFRAIFEDLGDISLYKWLKIHRNDEDIEAIYKKVIDSLLLIHIEATKHASECQFLRDKIFDYDHLRWESQYFIERFVIGIKNIEIKGIDALNSEFHDLAVKIDSFAKVVMHRDFQSQNIIISKNQMVRIIDYQGARVGPWAYDVASILWDPYYRLSDSIRDRLLAYYITELSSKIVGIINFSDNKFRQELILCRLHRHMQALGAYGFLSKVKGKDFFLKYIPEGIKLLKEDISTLKTEYPALYNLILML